MRTGFQNSLNRLKKLRYRLFFCLILLLVFAGPVHAKASNPLPINVRTVNSWKEGEKTCTQFSVTLKNTGKKPVYYWMLKLTMNRNVSIAGSWNGSYSVSKKVVTIRPLSYNKYIAAGNTAEIGFILKGSGSITFQKAAITSNVKGVRATYTQSKKNGFTTASAKAPTPTPTPAPTKKAAASPTPTPAPKDSSKTPLQNYGRLKVKGTGLVSSTGKAVTLKGVSTHGINWFPEYVNKSAFQTLRDEWGVDLIRLAMYTEEYNGYCSGGSKKELKNLIDKGVKAATELGMYVIIDWHILSDGNPQKNQKEAVSFFKEMSSKYKNYKNVIYEICNEPNGGTTWKQIKSYAQTVIKTIRANDKNNIILVGTPTWSQDVDVAARDPIKGYSNIMYTFHFYAGTHKDSYREKVRTAIDKGLPVFVSEFGASDASGNGSLDKTEANRWITFLRKNGISYVCWNLSNKNESSALLKSSSTRTGGFKTSDLSSHGLWYKAK